MISVDDLSVTLQDTPVLEEVSFSMTTDEFVLLVGRNGAGKTTLLDQLSGLDEPDAGSVHIDGHDIFADQTARASIGRVFENPDDQILGATVAADIALGPESLGRSPDAIDESVTTALEAVGLADCASVPVDTLSGGQRARVAIAGALAMKPAYLVLDEPTAGLDYEGRQAILQHITDVNRAGTGVLLATHDLRDLYDTVDRVIGLEDGRIAFDTTAHDAGARLDEIGVRVPAGWNRG